VPKAMSPGFVVAKSYGTSIATISLSSPEPAFGRVEVKASASTARTR
jgi:hypothetical protein